MSPRKLIQAKHLDEVSILQFLAPLGVWATHWAPRDWNAPDEHMPRVARAVPRETPEKVLRSKLGAMARRGLIDGCDCGCRGDWRILDAGRKVLSV